MTKAHRWTAEDIPDQSGKVALVTGGNSGLGYETVKELARHRAHVFLACRDVGKGNEARERICRRIPDATVEVMPLDLASLDSVRGFAQVFRSNNDQLHILANNAGVMATPYRTTTEGFELQFGTNHLGHFALTGLLLEVLLRTSDSRVVTVSSIAERMGRMNLENIRNEESYERWQAYARSKLANVLFAYELQRILTTVDALTLSVAAHPGVAATELRTQLMTRDTPLFHRIQGYFWEFLKQSVEMGALPQLYAATAPEVRGGAFYGPGGFLQRAGYPKEVRSSRRSHDEALARKLWRASEELTGIEFTALDR